MIFILLFLISPVGIWYVQSELNKVWRTQQGGGAEPATIPAAGGPAGAAGRVASRGARRVAR